MRTGSRSFGEPDGPATWSVSGRDMLAGLPVTPPVWQCEYMPLDAPVGGNPAAAGDLHYFPSRAARGMWPVVCIANGAAVGISNIAQGYIYVTLCDANGDKLLSEFPMGMFPLDPFTLGAGTPARVLQFDRLPVSWENSYWQLAFPVLFATTDALGLWVYYGKPSRR